MSLDLVASPVFVLEPDCDGLPRYVAFNEFARSISQRPLSDYLGQTAVQVYAGAFGRTAFARHCEVVQSGTAMTYELELPINGTTRDVRTTLIPQTSDGVVKRLYGSSIDLTGEVNTRKAQLSFDTIATEMEQFIAMAAHDLRAPLRNITLITDMLREDVVDHGDGKLDMIQMLEDVAGKSMALLSDVLSHAKATDITHSMATFNFAALCRDICDVIDPQEQHHFTYPATEICADRTALQVAVRNLIDNAVKYGDRKHIHIDIGVQQAQDAMLDVTLTDNGAGFSDAALAFLNGGKFAVDSGYGLLGVRRMVQARGGSMTTRNATEGSGAVIRFSLPGELLTPTASLGDALTDWSPGKLQKGASPA